MADIGCSQFPFFPFAAALTMTENYMENITERISIFFRHIAHERSYRIHHAEIRGIENFLFLDFLRTTLYVNNNCTFMSHLDYN